MALDEHDKLLLNLGEEIDKSTEDAFKRLLELIAAGTEARKAVGVVMEALVSEVGQHAADAFSAALKTSVSREEMLAYKIGDVSLSNKLYQYGRQTSTVVRQVVHDHVSGLHDLRQLALKIYDGYDTGEGVIAALEGTYKTVPRYIKDALSVDPEFYRGYLDKAVQMVLNIKTPPLRAAYMEALKAFEKNSKYLERKLRVVFEERMRYYANRIAQTEMHRAWIDKEAEAIMADDTVEVVMVRLSSLHTVRDICDIYARQDKYGLGPGLYPKDVAPKPTYHPYCRCRLVTKRLISSAGSMLNPESERAYLMSVAQGEDGLSGAARIIGSRGKLKALMDGGSFSQIVNTNVPDQYKLRGVGGQLL